MVNILSFLMFNFYCIDVMDISLIFWDAKLSDENNLLVIKPSTLTSKEMKCPYNFILVIYYFMVN